MKEPTPVDPITPVSVNVIALLERKLTEAKAGKLTSVGIVSVYDNGGIDVKSEGQPAPVLVGAVQLVEQVRAVLFSPAGQVPARLSS